MDVLSIDLDALNEGIEQHSGKARISPVRLIVDGLDEERDPETYEAVMKLLKNPTTYGANVAARILTAATEYKVTADHVGRWRRTNGYYVN